MHDQVRMTPVQMRTTARGSGSAGVNQNVFQAVIHSPAQVDGRESVLAADADSLACTAAVFVVFIMVVMELLLHAVQRFQAA